MQKLALLLSIVALGLGAYATWTSRESPCEVRALRGELDVVAGLETRVAALEAARAKAATPAPPEPARVDPLAAAPKGARAVPGSGDAESVTPEKAALAKVSSELESRILALEEKSRADASEGPHAARAGRLPRFPGGGKFYGSIDDAKEDLDLTDQQRGDFDRILVDARREMDELQKIPNEEGKTYEQVRTDMMSGLTDGSMKFDLSKLLTFRNSKVPGRDETYTQAESRIKSAARDRMRDTLTRDQQSKFDKAQIDPMLGGSFGTTFITTTVSADDAKPGGR